MLFKSIILIKNTDAISRFEQLALDTMQSVNKVPFIVNRINKTLFNLTEILSCIRTPNSPVPVVRSLQVGLMLMKWTHLHRNEKLCGLDVG